MQRIGLDAVPHDRTACMQLIFRSASFAVDLTDYEGSASVVEGWRNTRRVVWHNISVVVHGISSGVPAVVLLVLELFITRSTKVFLCQNMRRIFGCYARSHVHVHLSRERNSRELEVMHGDLGLVERFPGAK